MYGKYSLSPEDRESYCPYREMKAIISVGLPVSAWLYGRYGKDSGGCSCVSQRMSFYLMS